MLKFVLLKAPLVSIIVNNYNYAQFLRDAIESALGQTYAEIEVFVVDDGSTDDSRAVISRYVDQITPIFSENGGQGAALNKGFAASRGDVVIFLDSDDVLKPHTVERVVDEWRAGDAKVQYRLRLCDAALEPLPLTAPRATQSMPSGHVAEELLQRGDYATPPMSGNAFSRSFLQEVLPMPTEAWRRGADGYLNLIAPLFGTIRSLDEELGLYRQHGEGGAGLNKILSQETIGSWFRSRVLRSLYADSLLLEKATLRGYQVLGRPMSRNVDVLVIRLASLRLNADKHPVKTDNRVELLARGLVVEWRYSNHSVRWRIFMSLWLLAIGLLPRGVLERLIPTFYMSQFRPKWASRLLGKVKVASHRPNAAGRA